MWPCPRGMATINTPGNRIFPVVHAGLPWCFNDKRRIDFLGAGESAACFTVILKAPLIFSFLIRFILMVESLDSIGSFVNFSEIIYSSAFLRYGSLNGTKKGLLTELERLLVSILFFYIKKGSLLV